MIEFPPPDPEAPAAAAIPPSVKIGPTELGRDKTAGRLPGPLKYFATARRNNRCGEFLRRQVGEER